MPGAAIALCTARICLYHACGLCGESFLWTEGSPTRAHAFLCHRCKRDCVICFEAHAASAGLGCDSADAHFMCNECLDGHVQQSASYEELEKLRQCGGIKCPVPYAQVQA